MNIQLESVIGGLSFFLVIFTIWNTSLESDINQIYLNSTEFLIQSNFDISRSIATESLMEDIIYYGLSLNRSLIDIITSERYLQLSSNRDYQLLSANSSFSSYMNEKSKLNSLRKTQSSVSLSCNILAILNAFLGIILIRKRFSKKNRK